jgi:hypothetical protein
MHRGDHATWLPLNQESRTATPAALAKPGVA